MMVVVMGIMVTIMAFVPQEAIQVLVLAGFSFLLFIIVYILLDRWYLAALPPIGFVWLYLQWWNLIFLNIFAITFAVLISFYMARLFSWKAVTVFAALLTIMDVIQVFGTGYMGTSAEKMIQLRLPTLILVPTFPSKISGYVGLGLGDLFLAGLLSIQAALKYGRRTGILSAGTIGITFFIFEIVLLNYPSGRYFPATVIIAGGWLSGLGVHSLLETIRQHRQ